MALDPRVIAALSAGAKTSSTFDPSLVGSGGTGNKPQGAWNLGQGIIDILSTGGYATAGITSKLGQNVAAIGRGEVGAVADLLNPFSAIGAAGKGVADRRTYSENLKDMGVDPKAAVWLGLALDIGLDPTTYITGGALAGVKGAAQGAKIAGQATKAQKIISKQPTITPGLDKTLDTIEPVNRPLTSDEKLGNLLTGISLGYTKGKKNYKATAAANKLTRMERKAEKALPVSREAVEISPLFTAGDAARVASTSGKIAAEEEKVARTTAKVAKQRKKAEEAKAAAEAVPIEVSAGKPKAVESVDELSKELQDTKEGLASASKVMADLNEFAKKMAKPAVTAPKAAKFEKAKKDFNNAAFEFTSKELADLTGSAQKYSAVKNSAIKRYVDADKVVKAEDKSREIYERILAAPAVISDESLELQEALVASGARLNAVTVDDLLFLAAETKVKTVKDQAVAAINASKAALDETAPIVNLSSKPWIEGIITSNDAGDAARAIVDWIMPKLRESDPASFKAISVAIEGELAARLKRVTDVADAPLSAAQVEQVIGKMLDDGIGSIIAKISNSDLAEAIANSGNYNDIAELAADLQSGKLKNLQTADKRALSAILGVPQTKVQAKVIEMAQNVDTQVTVATGEPVAIAASKGPATTGDAFTAAGDVNGAEAGRLLEEATDNSPANLENVYEAARQAATEDYFAVLAKVPAKDRNQFEEKMVSIIRDYFLPGELKVIDGLAKATSKRLNREVSRSEIIALAIANDERVIKELSKGFTTSGAVRVSEAGSAGRIDIFQRVMDLRKQGAYKGMDETAIAVRESSYFSAVEALLRSMGILVKSTEPKAAALLRLGVKPRSKEATLIVPETSNVTWADIVTKMVDAGQPELAHRLRKVRGKKTDAAEIKLGNFYPTSIENAWLSVKRILSDESQTIVKGSKNYDEVAFALDNTVMANGEIIPGPHIKAAEKLGGKDAAEILKTKDDLIEFMVNNYEDLAKLDAGRSLLPNSATGKEIYPRLSSIFVRLLGFSDQMLGLKEYATASKTFEQAEQIVSEDLGVILSNYESLIKDLGSGFADPETAKHMFGLYTSILINQSWSIPAVNRRLSLAEYKSKAQKMAEIVQTSTAIQRATKGKKGKAVDEAGKNARNVKASMEKRRDAMTAQVAKGDTVAPDEELAELGIQRNGHIDAQIAEPNGWMQKLALSFSPKSGMGAALRQAMVSEQMLAFSWGSLMNRAMTAYARSLRGREAEVSAAFKALQAFKKEARAASKLNRTLTVDDFLTSSGLQIDREVFDTLENLTNNYFGDIGIFGAAKANAVLPKELGISLAKLGAGNDLLNAVKAAEESQSGIDDVYEALETFWYDMDLGDTNVFAWLEGVNFAIGQAASYVAMGQRFNATLGRSLDELKAAGEDLAKWKQLDPAQPGIVARIIGKTDNFFHEDDLKKLAFVERELQYGDPLSDGALSKFVELSDRIVYVLKSTQTILRPGHWTVSVVGEAAMNMLAGVSKYRYYNTSVRILEKFRFGQYNNAGEPLKAAAELSATKGKRINVDRFDKTIVTFGDKRQVVPDEAVFELAFREGALVNPYAGGGGIEDFIASNKTVIGGIYGNIHKGLNKLGTPAAFRDNFFRLAHFIHELENVRGAATLEEAARIAAQKVIDWHPTAANLTAFEKSYARRAVYFYTWQKVAAVTIISWMLQNPGKATILPKGLYALADANGFNPESFGDPWDPSGVYASWHTGQIYGPQFRSEGTFGDVVGIQPAIQPLDIVGQLAKPFSLQPGQSPIDSMAQGANDMFANNLNPLIKMLMESTAQSRLGEGGDLPSPSEYLINQVGVLSTLSKVSGIGQDPNPYETPQEKEERINRLWFNFITGQRVQDYNTPSTQYKWSLDQQEIARRLAGQ